MSYLREVTVGGAFPPFVALQALFGFVPNVFRAQTLLPRVIEAEAGIAYALLLEERDLSRIQKASMSLAISAAHGAPTGSPGITNCCAQRECRGIRSIGSSSMTTRPTCLHATRLCWILRANSRRGAPGSPVKISLSSGAARSATSPSWKQ